jgi:hypothetical protein
MSGRSAFFESKKNPPLSQVYGEKSFGGKPYNSFLLLILADHIVFKKLTLASDLLKAEVRFAKGNR